MRRLALVLLLSLAAALSGCDDGTCDPTVSDCSGTGGGTGGGGAGGSGGNFGHSWTVLVYMVGSNNLEPFALADLDEMAQVGSTSSMKMVVQLKRIAGYSSDPVGNL